MLAPEAGRQAAARDAARDAARADLCRFIAACYYEPAPEFAEERLFANMAAAAAFVDPELETLATRLGESFESSALQDLLVDYSRLFLGPVQALARPYASVWLTGENQVMQGPTLDVMKLYEEGGFGIDEDFKELPDHVAAELEFLYLLIFRENEARQAADETALAAMSSLKARFLEQHLGRWLGPFLLALHEGAETSFYERLAQMTERFVRLEAAGNAALPAPSQAWTG